MTAPTTRECSPRTRALQQLLLHELALGSRTTRQLAAALPREEEQAVYRALLSLEDEGKVKSFADRRGAATGRIGRVWRLPDTPQEITPQRDPLVAALFGDVPRRTP